MVSLFFITCVYKLLHNKTHDLIWIFGKLIANINRGVSQILFFLVLCSYLNCSYIRFLEKDSSSDNFYIFLVCKQTFSFNPQEIQWPLVSPGPFLTFQFISITISDHLVFVLQSPVCPRSPEDPSEQNQFTRLWRTPLWQRETPGRV